MAKNVLFNFIDRYLAESQASLPNCQSVELDSTIEGRTYYRLELEHTHPVVLQDEYNEYTLLNHHVSVYQTENQENPFLSQYHYTAYFKGKDGTSYQLHVYYNDKNEMTIKPVLSIRNETNDGFIPLESGQLDEDFINLARAYAKPLIKNIRKQLIETVKELEARYKKLDREASLLSVSIDRNYDDYLAKLMESAEIAKRLAPLVKHDHYQSAYRFTQRLITVVKEQYKPLATSTETQSSPLVENDKAGEETVDHSGEVKPSAPRKKGKAKQEQIPPLPQKRGPSPFDKKVQRIATEFGKLAEEDETVCATKFADLLARINELSLTLEDGKTVASLDSLAKLKNLQQKVQEAGEKLFTRLVLKGEFKLAEQMPSFYYLLDNYLDMALHTRNHQLLDFILKHGDININNQEVAVKGTVYLSAVHCCLSCDAKESPMADCLSVLIKHGASLFGSDENGLPIAHTILSAQNHPLKKALTANRDKTTGSIAFYEQLISTLKLYLAEHSPSANTETTIVKAIEYYQATIKELRCAVPPTNSSERKLKAQVEAFTDKHDTDVLERVRQDKEVIALRKEVQKAANAFHKKLDFKQRMAFAKAGSQNLDNIDKALEYFGVTFDNFEEMKQLVMEFLQHSLLQIAKQSELVEVQKEIRKFQLKPGRTPSRYTRLLTEQQQLMVEIAEMENKYAVKNIEQIKSVDAELNGLVALSNQLNQIQDSLKAMNKLFSLFQTGLEDDKGVEDEGKSEKISVEASNVNTVFNLFTPLLKSNAASEENDTEKAPVRREMPPCSNPGEQGPG